MELIKGKIEQAIDLLDEQDIDIWMIFVRESTMQSDPMMPMLVGFDVTWQSLFMYTRAQGAIAMIGNFDQENFKRSGYFDRVIPYTEGVKDDLLKVLDEIDPRNIALNFSTDDPSADGLTHGMYLQLAEYLRRTPYENRLVSASELCSRLRSRKLPAEVDILRHAAEVSDSIWRDVTADLKPGLTEKQIAAMIDERIKAANGKPAFETIVNAGTKTEAGHVEPTDARVAPGEVLHVDFGAQIDGYCADIQRLAYFRRDGEEAPPAEVSEAFEVVRDIITETGKASLPGKRGHEVDALAREQLLEHGFPVYQHALGHQLGRNVHDGGGIIGPRWERYGNTPNIPLENGNVFTLELEIILPGIGCLGLEEDMVVTDDGAEFLSPRQMELTVI